ncbi:MAG TPA: TRAP transporter substrate-binding protein [Burkholderiales bacterium]|nr:TRAP transporter substrate-binding protein [Burkholderiales bacterium]
MEPIRIRCGGYQPPASIHNRAAAILGAKLAERLGDAVHFELEGNVVGAGHRAAELLEWVRTGRMTMCYFSTSYLAEAVPELAVLDLPFVIGRREQAYAALDGALGARLSARLAEARGYKVLGYLDNGFRHLTNRRRPIRAPRDCRGLRIRTLASALHAQVFRSLGFEPVALDVKELVAAVSSGAVDAQDNPLTNIYNFGIHELHPYLTLSGHFWGAAALLCHGDTFAGWAEGVRAAVTDAAADAVAAQRRMAADEDVAALARLEAAGCEVVRLTESEHGEFVRAVAPVVAAQREALGPQLLDELAGADASLARVAG